MSRHLKASIGIKVCSHHCTLWFLVRGLTGALIDIFLPSSSEITIHNGIQKPETVHEIILTEEEYDSFLPS